jgi:hypothetical protein
VSLAAILVAAVAGLGEDTLSVRLVDAQGKALPGEAFVVSREFVSVPQFHGSKTYCFRGDIEAGTGERHVMRLPGVGLDGPSLLDRRYTALEAFAYAPGQCFERTPSARSAAGGARFPNAEISLGIKPGVEAGSETVLHSTPMHSPEERLLYLLDFAGGLGCADPHWSEHSAGNLERLSAAMLSEAQSLARDRYERHLVDELRGKLALAKALRTRASDDLAVPSTRVAAYPYPRDFIIAPANSRVSWQPRDAVKPGTLDAPAIAIVGFPAIAQSARVSPGAASGSAGLATFVSPGSAAVAQAAEPLSRKRVIHCRNGPVSACDLDERDMSGSTALAGAVADLDAEATQLLLEAGADPAVQVNVAGLAAPEALVSRIIQRPPAPGSEEEQRARTIVALLAASPKASLLKSVGDDLASDPKTWLPTLASRTLLLEMRGAWRNLPVRADPPPPCDRIEPATLYTMPLTPRLRPHA